MVASPPFVVKSLFVFLVKTTMPFVIPQGFTQLMRHYPKLSFYFLKIIEKRIVKITLNKMQLTIGK